MVLVLPTQDISLCENFDKEFDVDEQLQTEDRQTDSLLQTKNG
jgi:hypothetical protein